MSNYFVFLFRIFLFASFLMSTNAALIAQINPENIDIVRDKWGVPHIYAPTDAEVAYGFAWATAEDDFKTMQESLLAVKGRLGEYIGKEGAIFDFIGFAIGVNELVDSTYQKDLSPEFRKIVDAYAAAANDYAAKHPKEVLLKKVFPIEGKDIIKGYVFALTFMTNVQIDLLRIFEGFTSKYEAQLTAPKGSNGIAISPQLSSDGQTYLAVNSHQPLEGKYSWYEAHLHSDEGWNMMGGAFPGAVSLFVGTTPNLGWTHTLNYNNLSDVYKLKMHPTKKNTYYFDGEWHELVKRKKRIKVKIAGLIKIPISRTFYWSKYGATFKNEHGYYALRFPANMSIKSSEQWFLLNKAKNFEEYKAILEMHDMPGTNIIYADKEHNIYYLSNGQYPYRNPAYDWSLILPGDTSATLWTTDSYYPIDSLPQILNPECGYLFECNNSPFDATCPDENLQPEASNPTMGMVNYYNNRSRRFQQLFAQYDKISYEDFKTIKYDRLRQNEPTFHISNIDRLFNLDENKYPELKESILALKDWDKKSNPENTEAIVFALFYMNFYNHCGSNDCLIQPNEYTDEDFIFLLEKGHRFMMKHYGKIRVPLGEVQRHSRGDVSLPIGGTIENIAAIHPVIDKKNKGKLRADVGESYIMLIRYTDEGPIIETVNAYGASAKPDSPHYTDQMEMFVNQQLKPMTLDKEEIYQNAERKYHPQ